MRIPIIFWTPNWHVGSCFSRWFLLCLTEPENRNVNGRKIVDCALMDIKAEIGKVYYQDPDTGAFAIEVALDRYDDIFNERDPAPYRRRDVDPDIESYLELCAADIPLKYSLSIVFRAPESIKDRESERLVLAGLDNFFAFELKLMYRQIRRLNIKTVQQMLIAFFLLLIAQYSSRFLATNLVLNVVREGIYVGAWVFAWESVSTFFFRKKEIRRRMKEWERLKNAEIRFVYRQETVEL